MQAAGQVITHLQGLPKNLDPGLADDTAPVCHTDHQRPGTFFPSLFKRHVGGTHISVAAIHPKLSDHVFRTPILDTLCDFRSKLIGRIAQEKKIRCANHGNPRDFGNDSRAYPK